MPPFEKVYEAMSAIGDGRIEMHDTDAVVSSSNGSKKYTVTWEGNRYLSDDSATYWQGYPGYPVIAVLMKQGKLPENNELCEKLKGIEWKKLNDRHRRDYAAAAAEAFSLKGLQEQEVREVTEFAGTVFEQLEQLDIETGRGKRKK